MKSNDVRDFALNIEQLCRSDPEYLNIIGSIMRANAPSLVQAMLDRNEELQREALAAAPFPERSQITAAQLSIFDNWTDGQRPSRKRGDKNARKVRYKAILDIWCGAEKLTTSTVAYRAQFNLMTKNERLRAMEKYRNPAKSRGGFVIREGVERDPEWQEFDDALINLPDDLLAGPSQVRGGSGTSFGLNVLAGCNAEDLDNRADTLEVLVFANGESLRFNCFTNTYAGRGGSHALKGNVVLSSRLAVASEHVAWRTGLLSCPVADPNDNSSDVTVDDLPF